MVIKAVYAEQGQIGVGQMDEPDLLPGFVRIRTEYSAISPGTELSMARQSAGQRLYLGYSAAGLIERVGEGVTDRYPGQRVACYGGPYVRHAEVLAVPVNLTAPVPDHVRLEEAAFAGLGAIAIHALRMSDVRFGESAVVVGLGILGNLLAQIANASAIQTAGLDLRPERTELLRGLGLRHIYDRGDELEAALQDTTGGRGADHVLICAASQGGSLLNDAIGWLRDRGSVVVVGDVDVHASRSMLFQKEARLVVSRAGGPGRYDSQYEKDNRDYPIGYVRWTEGRNTAEYIRLLAEGRIQVKPLITGVYPLNRADEAYKAYATSGSVMGTLLKYGNTIHYSG